MEVLFEVVCAHAVTILSLVCMYSGESQHNVFHSPPSQ